MQGIFECETKWSVDAQFAVPPLNDVVPGGRVVHATMQLSSTYYDTAEHDLQAFGIRLRRRTGDVDSGWQLKIPAADGNTELRATLSDELPIELGELLVGVSLGKPLRTAATIRTDRERYRLREPSTEKSSVQLVDDHVHASAATSCWDGERSKSRFKLAAAPCPVAWPSD